MKTNERGSTVIAGMIVLVGLIALGATVYFLVKGPSVVTDTATTSGTPTPNSNQNVNETAVSNTNGVAENEATKDWKEYTNSDLGYSLKYPQDWTLNKTSDTATVDKFGLLKPGSKSDTQFVGEIFIQAFAKDKWSGVQSGFKSKRNVTVGGQSGVEYTDVEGLIVEPLFTVVEKGAYVYTFALTMSDGTSRSTYERVIGTIKFTDPTAGWKTYSAPTAGYQFKYPDGLGNAEIAGGGYLGGLDGPKAQTWEQNLLVIDADKSTRIIYFYAPKAGGSTLDQEVDVMDWNDTKKYQKGKEVVNGVTFDVYVPIGTLYGDVAKGYAVSHGSRNYLISLMNTKLETAKSILSTFTFTK